jgi:hypothetical protein
MGATGSVPQEVKQQPMMFASSEGTIGDMMGNKTGINMREPAVLQGSGGTIGGMFGDGSRRGFTGVDVRAQEQGFGGIMKSNFQHQGSGTVGGFWGRIAPPGTTGFGGQVQGQGTMGQGFTGGKQIAPPDTSASSGPTPLQTFADVKPIGSTATGKIGEVVGTVSGVATQAQP